MPKTRRPLDSAETVKPISTKSPFKEQVELEKEIVTFINRFKTTVADHGKRMSDFFEMSCYNLIVRFYENEGYTIEIENLQKGEYRYKCSTRGIQSNFSHFLISKKIGRKNFQYEIHHNLAVQSSHDPKIFVTPDISVIKKGAISEQRDYYDTNTAHCYVVNENMISFCEVKHFNPFPELLFNFIGIVHELRKEIIANTSPAQTPSHIAPSLMISGKPNKPAVRIKESLEARYCINVICDIFDSGISTFSKSRYRLLRQVGMLEKSISVEALFSKPKHAKDELEALDKLPF